MARSRPHDADLRHSSALAIQPIALLRPRRSNDTAAHPSACSMSMLSGTLSHCGAFMNRRGRYERGIDYWYAPFRIPDYLKTPKVITALAASVYIVGMIEINANLLQYGVSDFNILRARYLMTGALTLGFFATIGLLISLASYPISLAVNNKSWSLRIFYGLWVCLFVSLAIKGVSIFAAISIASSAWTTLSVTLCIAGTFLLLWELGSAEGIVIWREGLRTTEPAHPIIEKLAAPTGLVIYSVLALILYLSFFSSKVLTSIPAQFGGMQPEAVTLIVNSGYDNRLTTNGIPVDSATHSVRLVLLYESQDFVLVRRGQTIARLDRDTITGWVRIDRDLDRTVQ